MAAVGCSNLAPSILSASRLAVGLSLWHMTRLAFTRVWFIICFNFAYLSNKNRVHSSHRFLSVAFSSVSFAGDRGK